MGGDDIREKMLVFACDRRFFPGETRSRRNRGTAGGRADDKIFGCQQLVQIRKIKVSVEHNLNRLSSFPCALVPSTLNCFPALSGETLTTSQIFIYFNTEFIVLC